MVGRRRRENGVRGEYRAAGLMAACVLPAGPPLPGLLWRFDTYHTVGRQRTGQAWVLKEEVPQVLLGVPTENRNPPRWFRGRDTSREAVDRRG